MYLKIIFLKLGLAALLVFGCSGNNAEEPGLKDGDLIFQSSAKGQGLAVQKATGAKYSHMGIVYTKDGEVWVYEAVGPVKLTKLDEWKTYGDDEHYVVKRLKNAEDVLDDQTLARMKQAGEKYMGKPYNLYFEWDDKRIYCSELVWKIYKEAAGVEIGELQKLKDFDLSSPVVQQKMKERYGENVPYEEKVISPGAMFNSDKLVTVMEN